MTKYSWKENQEVILLGVREAGKHLIDKAGTLELITSQQSNQLENVGYQIIRKLENCQENHLKEALNFLIDL